MSGFIRKVGEARWRVYVPHPTERYLNGNPKQISRTVLGMQRDAEHELARLRNEVQGGMERESQANRRHPRYALHDEEQLRRLLERATKQDDCLYPLLLVALTTGMHRGQILGLRWHDVDLDAGMVTITRSLEDCRTHLHFLEALRLRTIPLPHITIQALVNHSRRQDDQRSQLGNKHVESGLVFATPTGQPQPPRIVSGHLRALRQAGFSSPPTFRDLRSIYAIMLLRNGVAFPVVQHLLGIKTPRVTMKTHLSIDDGVLRDAVAVLHRYIVATGGSVLPHRELSEV